MYGMRRWHLHDHRGRDELYGLLKWFVLGAGSVDVPFGVPRRIIHVFARC